MRRFVSGELTRVTPSVWGVKLSWFTSIMALSIEAGTRFRQVRMALVVPVHFASEASLSQFEKGLPSFGGLA